MIVVHRMQTVWLMDKLLKYPFLDRVPDSLLWLTDFLRKIKRSFSTMNFLVHFTGIVYPI